MQSLVDFLQQTGAVGLDVLWMPLLIWSVFAVIILGFLKLAEPKISSVYQYHGRVAVLLGLIAGVGGSCLVHYFPAGSAVEQVFVQPFFVIQGPIAVTAAAGQPAIDWTSPMLWVGFASALALILAIWRIIKLLVNLVSLRGFSRTLALAKMVSDEDVSDQNRQLIVRQKGEIKVVFSEMVDIPCTFGLFKQRVVLPLYLQADKAKMNMALRHELIHIEGRDYMINTVVQWIQALFYVHPLVHKFGKDIEQYREICCDQKVLQSIEVSQKSYAQLLFDLSPRSIFKTSSAVNMAVQPSTLKKRIQTMKNSTHNIPSLRWSVTLMLVFGFIISGLMACSDVTDNGITTTEVQKTQARMGKISSRSTVAIKGIKGENQPLLIIDGEKMDTPEEQGIFSRLNPHYIKSITVLKGEKAQQVYGEAGKNGVIKIELNVSKKLAFSNLLAHAPDASDLTNLNKEEIFLAVQHMPRLKISQAEFQSHVQYPKTCSDAGIEGRVIVQFVVNKQGMPTNVQVVRGIGGGCDEAAVAAVKNYARFTPGKQKGKPVNVRMSLPILFKIPDSTGTSN